MVVGGTGCGKTTFLNTLANHACGIKFEDDFRFKLKTGEALNNNG